MDALDRYGAPTWFRLGDRDLATHLYRTARLRAGATLSAVTAEITAAWDVRSRLVPMTDDRVATRITVRRDSGLEELAMQAWFVQERSEPPVVSVRFEGAELPTGTWCARGARRMETIPRAPEQPGDLDRPILVCPACASCRRAARRVVGVSPIIGTGRPRPADRLMGPLGMDVSRRRAGATHFCSTLVIDALTHTSATSNASVCAVVADTHERRAPPPPL
jgi:LPPG:FO 2-phospho-L-lactate transferase